MSLAIYFNICRPTLLFAQGNVRHIRSFFILFLLFAFVTLYVELLTVRLLMVMSLICETVSVLWFKVFFDAAFLFSLKVTILARTSTIVLNFSSIHLLFIAMGRMKYTLMLLQCNIVLLSLVLACLPPFLSRTHLFYYL